MYLFNLSLSQTENKNLHDIIMLQIEEHIPLKAIDTVFDYDVISEDSENIIVQVVAIAISSVESYLSVFTQAGLTPLSFELEAQAIARVAIPQGDLSTVMILDFGDSRSGVSIASKGRVLSTTTLDIGGVNLTNLIAKNFSLSFEEAEKIKKSYGLGGNSNVDDIFPVIINGISVLRDELDKQYSYWKTHEDGIIKHEPIDRLILCGGDANLIGLSNYLTISMKMKVEHARVWTNISDMDTSVPDMSYEESLGYTTVLGLALGGYLYDDQSLLNVLPSDEKKSQRREHASRYLNMILMTFSFICFNSIFLLFPSYFFSKTKEDLAEQRLEAFNKDNPEIITGNINEIINKVNSNLKILSSADANYKVSEKVFANLLANRPANIIFSQILLKKNETGKFELEVMGRADNRTALRDFKTVLDNVAEFSEVNLPMSNFLEKADLSFTINILMK
jgi:type IV pilus assembly protein PilM